MKSEAPGSRKAIKRAFWVGAVGAVTLLGLAMWSGWDGLLVGAFGCLMWVVGCCIALRFHDPSPVLWEEDPRYQDAQFRSVLMIGTIGTLFLLGLSLWSGDWSGMLTWIGLMAAVMLLWLLMVGLVALGWRIFEGRGHRRAKNDPVAPV